MKHGHYMGEVKFHFDFEKSIAAMAYVLHRLGPTDKVKLMKLMYIADRDCFLKHGHPITGSNQRALPHGPVPSQCLNAINGILHPHYETVFEHLHVSDNQVRVQHDFQPEGLDHDETAILDAVITEHGDKGSWVLVEETHGYPEYKAVAVPNSSRPIPYELLLKLYGGRDAYAHNRPVISAQTMAHMVSPFAESEPDL